MSTNMQRVHKTVLRDKNVDGMKLLKHMDDRYRPLEEHRVGTAKKKFEQVTFIQFNNNVEKWSRKIMRLHRVIISGGKHPEKMACEEHIKALLISDNIIIESYVKRWSDLVHRDHRENFIPTIHKAITMFLDLNRNRKWTELNKKIYGQEPTALYTSLKQYTSDANTELKT